ncbi:hypothetical protein F5B21DRAFT_526526 [Xylaria acuta]|nr:hypothetical protein F5B21DRAFT_526526 [Xylaria acuta]
MNQQDEEQPVQIGRGRGRPPKSVSNGRRGRPFTTYTGHYQARGLRAPKTNFAKPAPTRMQTRLKAGAARKEYKQGIYDTKQRARRRNPPRRKDEGEDGNEDDELEEEEEEEDSSPDSDSSSSDEPQRGHIDRRDQKGVRHKDAHPKVVDDDSNEDSDPFAMSDSDSQPPRILTGDSRGAHYQNEDEDTQHEDDDMHIGYDDMQIDNEGDAYFAGGDDDEVVAETPGKHPREDSPDPGVPQPPKRRALRADHDDIGGQPPSLGHPTILQTPLEIVTLSRLRIRGKFPVASKSYLDGHTLRGSYWSSHIERAFQDLWKRDEQDSRFVQGPRGDSDELELWKMVFIRYETIIPHLFTYGLKLGEDCYEAPGSIMLSSKASNMLQKICAHQVWGFTFDSLRFVLQTAVKLSVDKHFDPIGAPPDTTGVEDFAGDIINEDLRDEFFGNIRYRLWMENKPDSKLEIWRLIQELEQHIKPSPAEGDPETSLFILTVDVMDGVLRALAGFKRWVYPSPEESVEAFRRYHGNVLAGFEPVDNRQLMDIKWELELNELRDEEIRKVMKLSSDKKKLLHDIPHPSRMHSDNVPLYHHDINMDKDALQALAGEAKDPKRCTLRRLDRVDEHRARALDDFSRRLEDNIYHRTESSESSKAPKAPIVPDAPVAPVTPVAPGAPEAEASEKTQVQGDGVMANASDASATQSRPSEHVVLGEASEVPLAGSSQSKVLAGETVELASQSSDRLDVPIISGDGVTLMDYPVRPPRVESSWGRVDWLEGRVLSVPMETTTDMIQMQEALRSTAVCMARSNRLHLEMRRSSASKFSVKVYRGDNL